MAAKSCRRIAFSLLPKAADVEMLFDPAKQQLDLPPGFVEGGDVDGGALQVIGQQGDGFAVGSLDHEAAQPHRQCRIALAGEAHLSVAEHGETIALRPPHDGRSPTGSRRILVLGRGEEDRALPRRSRSTSHNGNNPCQRHRSPPAFEGDRATDLGVVDVGIGDVEDARTVGLRVKDDMHLQAADAPVRFGPVAQLAERDRRRNRSTSPWPCRRAASADRAGWRPGRRSRRRPQPVAVCSHRPGSSRPNGPLPRW